MNKMKIYNYDKNCDCIQVMQNPEEEKRLEDLREYFDYLKEEMIDVEEEISRINC